MTTHRALSGLLAAFTLTLSTLTVAPAQAAFTWHAAPTTVAAADQPVTAAGRYCDRYTGSAKPRQAKLETFSGTQVYKTRQVGRIKSCKNSARLLAGKIVFNHHYSTGKTYGKCGHVQSFEGRIKFGNWTSSWLTSKCYKGGKAILKWATPPRSAVVYRKWHKEFRDMTGTFKVRFSGFPDADGEHRRHYVKFK